MPFPQRAYLTGFMASGKSTIGPIVANVLGYDFVDLDAAIEARAGCTIPELFDREGEPAFRKLEADLLRETARQQEVVVALGGGALVDVKNRRLARQRGVVIFLHVPLDELVGRLIHGSTVRPLLTDEAGRPLSPERLEARVEAMMEERLPLYREAAHVTVEVGSQRVGLTVDAVVDALRRHGRGES